MASVAAAAAVAGCGGGAAGVDPSATTSTPVVAATPPVTPPPVGLLNRGDPVTPGKKTPAPVVAALKSGKPVVIALLYGGAADEAAVRAAVGKVRSSVTGRDARYFVYDVSRPKGFGDVPARLGITETPSVAVIGGDGRIVNVFTGLVDAEILGQSLSTAREATP